MRYQTLVQGPLEIHPLTQGFGPKRPPTSEELDLLNKVLGGGL
jgi:hypothetical protein